MALTPRWLVFRCHIVAQAPGTVAPPLGSLGEDPLRTQPRLPVVPEQQTCITIMGLPDQGA